MIICKICQKKILNVKGFPRHFKCYHNNLTVKEYYDKYYKKPNEGICPVCGKETPYRGFIKGYQKTCSISCSLLLEENKQKRECTYFEKTGYKCPLANKELRRDYNKKYKELTGYDCPQKNPEVIKKAKNTLFERTGYTSPIQIPEIKEKIKNTYFERTGYNSPFKNPEVINKIKENNLKKYGYEYLFNSNEFQQKIINERFIRTGYKNSSQNPNISTGHKTYEYNNILFDSSWELAYYIWLTDNNIDFEYHPNISFEYFIDNTKHIYKPDFKVGSTFIEIKNDYLLSEKCEYKIPDEKINCMNDKNITILCSNEMKPILKYIKTTYGTKYLQQFKKT